MPNDSIPSSPMGGGDVSHALPGPDIGAAHVAESQLSTHADIAAARNFFQPATSGMATPAFTTSGSEIGAVAGKAAAAATGAAGSAEASALSAAAKSIGSIAGAAGSEAAAMGAHALAGIGSAAAGAAEVSPMIQLIMRLPGLGGVAGDFFEWLMALFTAPSHLADIFDPTMWAHLGASIQSSLSNLVHGVGGVEHFQVPLSMLPGNAPFLQQLGMQAGHGIGLSDLHRIGTGIGAGGAGHLSLSSTFSVNNHLNISSPLDLKKPQFEMGSSINAHSGLRLDGKMSGPQLSGNGVNSNFLSGTQRLFTDQTAKSSSLLSPANSAPSNFVSNSASPAGSAGSSMNISSNSFSGSDVGSAPANYQMSDGVMSGPGISGSNNVGFHLSDSAPAASMDRAASLSPSGGVSDTLGGKELMASNDVPSYQPSMGGSYFKPASGMQTPGAGADAPAPSGMQELKAEPMSMLKKAHTAGIGHVPDKGAVDSIGHQTKGAIHSTPTANSATSSTTSAGHQAQSMDQVSHRGSAGHANADSSASKHVASKEVSGDSSAHHHVAAHHPQAMDKIAHTQTHHVAQHIAKPQVERVSSTDAQPGTAQAQSPEQAAGAEKTAMANAGGDKASTYSVQHGDNLWDIAKKQLGDGSRWGEIYKMNSDVIGNNPSLIHGGLELKMPGADNSIAEAGGNYTVTPGDNLWNIAKDKLGDGSRWGEIYDVNKAVIGENPSLIMPGEQLQMPGGAQAISQAPAAPQTLAMQAPDPNAAMQAAPAQGVSPEAASYQPQAEMASPESQLSGPGAAGAATLDATQFPTSQMPALSTPPSRGPVSASLAPDLSFLSNPGRSN